MSLDGSLRALPVGDPEASRAWVASELGDLAFEDPEMIRASPRFRGGQSEANRVLAALDVAGYASRRNQVQPRVGAGRECRLTVCSSRADRPARVVGASGSCAVTRPVEVSGRAAVAGVRKTSVREAGQEDGGSASLSPGDGEGSAGKRLVDRDGMHAFRTSRSWSVMAGWSTRHGCG